MSGENVDSTLRLSEGEDSSSDPNGVMLLTDKRIIYIQGNGKRRKATFASISDIDSVEISVEQQGRSSYVWAAMAFIVAVLLFITIPNSTGRIIASVVVGAMGVYLVVDQLFSPGKQFITFGAGSSQLRCDLGSDLKPSDVYGFINRVFQLKGHSSSNGYSRAGRFAPH